MRSVTVRVTEEGDWQFRAERADGRLLFALEFTESAPADTVELDTELAPPKPAEPRPVPYHLGDFGMMLGSPNDEWDQQLWNLRDVVELALPTIAGARVVEIGAGSGETTVAYASQWQGADVFWVDPDLKYFGNDTDGVAAACRRHNGKYLEQCHQLDACACESGDRLDKQDLSLLVIPAKLDRKQQARLLESWLRHMMPNGRVVLRLPDDGTPLTIKNMEIHQAGEWLLYSPALAEGGDDGE